MIKLDKFIIPLALAQPALRFQKVQIAGALVTLIAKNKEQKINTSSYPDDVFCWFVANRVTIIFAHIRKLKVDKRYAEAIAQTNDDQIKSLDKLLESCYNVGSTASATSASSAMISPAKRARILEREPTLDGDGYPVMFKRDFLDSQIQKQLASYSDSEDQLHLVAHDMINVKITSFSKHACQNT